MAPQELQATPTRIVVVEWRIKEGWETTFLEYWSTQSSIPDRSGLISEFLSRVESREDFPWINWDVDEKSTLYVNVGIWREGSDFQQQFGRHIDDTKPLLPFEARRRRRVFLAPERWRIGQTPLLNADHPDVR